MTQSLSLDISTSIRDAATVILLRHAGDEIRVLMGQRGKSAVFMPGKFVFPGGAVDPQDYNSVAPYRVNPLCRARLEIEATPELASALLVAAHRELLEETGLNLDPLADMRFVFRAITPPARPRRFDARFLMCDAGDVLDDLDDFSRAEDELAHLQWVSVPEALTLDLPFVTRIVLAEVNALAAASCPPEMVPFYDHRGPIGQIRSLG
jgi:8-oxo-dGTP pyrophosphatase MutT (NUDIX family)